MVSSAISLSRVHHSERIDRRILDVVKRGNFILGPECKAFEAELAAYFGVKHVVLSSPWTAAVHLLHIAHTMTGKLKPGDEILVPSLTAFPSIEPMIHAGARPIFCDVDETYTIDPDDARRRITSRTVGILPVHLYGRPCNLDAIRSLAQDHGLWVIEDCAQAHGARWKNQRVGSFTEHAAFSFYPSKNLTVYGDGGAIATSDARVAQLISMLRNHGRQDKYLHEKVGFNLRFNEIQVAVGREQLKVLDQLTAHRRRVASWYRREMADVKGLTLPPDDREGQIESVYHLFVIRLESFLVAHDGCVEGGHDLNGGLGPELCGWRWRGRRRWRWVMEDLSRFCCLNPECSLYGKRNNGNLYVRARYGPHKRRLLLCCRTCQSRFSERKGTPLFGAKLSEEKSLSVLEHLHEGCGVRQTARLTRVNRNTVGRLAWQAGGHAKALHDELVAFSPANHGSSVRREVGLRRQEAGAHRPGRRPGRHASGRQLGSRRV